MDKQVNYGVFNELLKLMDINPIEFKKYSGGKVYGFFPDLPERKSKKAKKLAKLIWKEGWL